MTVGRWPGFSRWKAGKTRALYTAEYICRSPSMGRLATHLFVRLFVPVTVPSSPRLPGLHRVRGGRRDRSGTQALGQEPARAGAMCTGYPPRKHATRSERGSGRAAANRALPTGFHERGPRSGYLIMVLAAFGLLVLWRCPPWTVVDLAVATGKMLLRGFLRTE